MREPDTPEYRNAKRRYEQGGIGVPRLAAEFGLPRGTVASWARRFGWTKGDADAADAGDVGGDPGRDLPPRRARLAQVLPFAKTKTEAAQTAGYARSSARHAVRRATRDDTFRKALRDAQETQAELMDRLGVTAERIVMDLVTIRDRCLGGYELRDKKGRPLTAPIRVPVEGGGELEIEARLFGFDAKQAFAAVQELADLHGMHQRAKDDAGGKQPDFVPLDEIVE